VSYEAGPWSMTAFQNFQKSYHDITGGFPTPGNTVAQPRTVGNYETYDAQVLFNGFRNLQLALGVKNLTDRNPPYTNGGGQFAAGYDIAYADVRGRFVYGSVTFRFR
jgi:iron complex outermembrane receptor protein